MQQQPPIPNAPPKEFAALLGIDWADAQHDICLMAAGCDRPEHAVVKQSPEALAEWVNALRQRFANQPLAICLEQTRGPLIYALMKYEFLVLFPIDPAKLASYRKAITSSGAKDDPTDAALLLDYLSKHRVHLRPWKPDDALSRQIALLAEGRRKAVNLRTRLSNALKAELKSYFPQALAWLNENLHSPLACDFLLRWPTLQGLQGARPQTIRKFFYGHNCRRGERLEKLLQQIPQAQPLSSDTAILGAAVLNVQMLAKQLRPLSASIQAFDKQLAELFAQHPDRDIFDSLPGAGPALAPRLLGAFGSDRGRFSSAEEIQSYSGIAPITRRSGKKCSVQRRWACPKFLRQTFCEFAAHSISKSSWAKAYYQRLKERGKKHQAAVRALAFKWMRIIFRCWQSHSRYQEGRYLSSLERRGSALLAYLPSTAVPGSG